MERDGRFLLDKVIMPIDDDKGERHTHMAKDKDVMMFVFKRSSILMTRYPSDALWSPLWLVGQRFYKIVKNRKSQKTV